MNTYYYYKSLRKNIIQFLDIFNNIQIGRYDSNGNITDTFEVPLKFAPKSKAWYWIYEKKDDEMLPMMSSEITSIEYAAERQGNKLRNIVKSRDVSQGTLEKFLNPVPYNIGFQLNLWSKYMIDVDQILEQILPYFSPNIFMRINMSQLDASFDVKVLLNSTSPDLNSEYQDEDRRIILWSLDFTIQTYLFKPVSSSGLIEKIITKIYTNEDKWNDYRFTETTFTSGASGHEAVAMYHKALGYDDDGDILYNYERWGE